MKKKHRLTKQFSPAPTSKKSKSAQDTTEEINRPKLVAFICVILFAILAILFFGCRTAPPVPLVTYNDKFVEYHALPVNGFIGRTQDGNYLVTAGYVKWAEHLNVDLEAANAKLEQERLKNLNVTK